MSVGFVAGDIVVGETTSKLGKVLKSDEEKFEFNP